MKTFFGIAALVTVVLFYSTAQAGLQVTLTGSSFLDGAFSYDASGDNVVHSGTAFYDTLHGDTYLGTQTGNPKTNVEGNLAMYGTFSYKTSDHSIQYLYANPNQLLALNSITVTSGFFSSTSLTSSDRNFLNTLGTLSGDTFTFTVGDNSVASTMAAVGAWGYTEIATGVYLDVALTPRDSSTGVIAVSLIVDTKDAGFGTLAYSRDLDYSGELPDGMTFTATADVSAVPEPCTLAVWSLMGGVGMAGGWLRRRKLAV